MTETIEALRREYERVSHLPNFDSSRGMRWICMRNAAIGLASRGEHPALEAAGEPLRACPENMPDEGAHWLALREAVEKVLELDSPR